MNDQQYNALISEAVRLQKLVKRHATSLKAVETDLLRAMIADKLDVKQGKAGTVTYKGNVSKTTSYDLLKLFKKLKIVTFIKLIAFNATKAKPLIKSGEIDSKLIDSITTIGSKTTPAKLKIQAI